MRDSIVESGDGDDLRQKSSGKNDTLPTMESTTSIAMAAVKDPAKKEGRLAGGERGPLSRCLFSNRPFFHDHTAAIERGTYMRSDHHSHRARSSIA